MAHLRLSQRSEQSFFGGLIKPGDGVEQVSDGAGEMLNSLLVFLVGIVSGIQPDKLSPNRASVQVRKFETAGSNRAKSSRNLSIGDIKGGLLPIG